MSDATVPKTVHREDGFKKQKETLSLSGIMPGVFGKKIEHAHTMLII